MAAVKELIVDPVLTLTAIPLLGAGIGVLLWSRPRTLKAWALFLTAALVVVAVTAGTADGDAAIAPLSWLLILASFLAVFGQDPYMEAPSSIVLTLLFLGLSLGTLASGGALGIIFFSVMLGVIGLAMVWHGRTTSPMVWGAVALCGIGVLCLVASLAASGSVAVVLRLVAFATALPLFPLHGVFVGALSHLPGSLPAFLAVALPSLGVHGVVSISAAVPAGILPSLLLLALIGALYGSLKALVQCHLGQMVAYLAVTLLAIPWWHMAVTAGKMPQAAGYVSAVAVAMGGLLLAGHFVQARYGHLDLDKLRGLARPMPRFATLFGLLIMAAMGLPLFGVFSAFMAMMFSSSTTLPQSIVVILLVWFMASWLLVMLMQRILFGQPRPDLLYRDLSQTEVLSLVLVLCLLALGGIVPAGLFQLGDPAALSFLEVNR
ncbi:MAG TPA: proton-conducting transporter membrane subunit [Dehalococcoidia bacterium]|nr:proton-conducting transporter membrane subunit [Dehalococcoidia bacterium]HLE79955.1 proton-conducting transporter membrane subunit [Dehalococcoidia bacterium]